MTRRQASVRTLCVATAAVFLGAIAGRPIVDPSCLGHHAEDSGAGTSHAAHPQTGHAPTPSPQLAGGEDHGPNSALMQACLCWYAGMAAEPPSFAPAAHAAPMNPPASGPKAVALQPTPFELPFANGPPALA